MKNRIKRLAVILVYALLVVALVSATLPAPTRAATTCASYYTIKSGDTTPKIAQTYGMKWGLIAKANDMEYPYKLKVGEKLCIPPLADKTDEKVNQADSLKMSAKSTGGSISITIKGISTNTSYIVRVRDGNASVGGWYKLGKLSAKKNTTTTLSFSLPKELRSSLYLQVCLKNATTDELACRIIIHR